MRRTLLVSSLVAASALVALSACRQPRRSVRVGSDAATLKVTMTNLDKVDEGRTDRLYELSGCVSTLSGQVDAANVVSFTSVGLKEGLTCQLHVRALSADVPGISFSSDSEKGVFYFGRDFLITKNAAGGLEAKVGLQKLYIVEPTVDAKKSFTLKVPVTFKAPEADKPLTAGLVCQPAIANPGIYPDDNPVSGEFTFTVAVDQETPFACTEILVNANGRVHKYRGLFAGDAGKFNGVPDQTVTTKPVELKLQETGGGSGEGVQVETTAEDCAQEGKVFDTVKRECK